MRRYHCYRCGKTVTRESRKGWIKSFCETKGRMTILWRVP